MAHPNKKNNWLTPGEFKNLSNDEQLDLVKKFKKVIY